MYKISYAMNYRKFFVLCSLTMAAVLCQTLPILAQNPEREYVIAVGDQLDIQVWSKVQPMPNFSSRVDVRPDNMITMPWLGDIRVAGLKKSTLTSLLESKEFLGKYLTEPYVTITPLLISTEIQVFFTGVIGGERELPRDTRWGALWRELQTQIQQYNPDLKGVTITSAEGEVFPSDFNIRLQWGDTIAIPAIIPTPTPLPRLSPEQLRAQFTREQYAQFETFMGAYPEAYQELLPFLKYEGETISLDLIEMPENQRQRLPQAVLEELQKYPFQAAPVQEPQVELLGITVNLRINGLREAFLAFPGQDGGTRISRVREGDEVYIGENTEAPFIVKTVDEKVGKVVLKQDAVEQTLAVKSGFTNMMLAGIVTNHKGQLEAILEEEQAKQITPIPIQRKRYTEGEEVETGVFLAKISRDQELAILQKEQEVQLLFLRDPRKRPTPQPTPSPLPTLPADDSGPESPQGEEQALGDMLRQQMPPQVQAVDTLSEMFWATPLF
jgi:hypothetical protein